MKQLLTLAMIAGITVAGAWAHGTVTGRWQPAGQVLVYSLPDVPLKFGDWTGEDMTSLLDNDPVLKHSTRKYTHGKTGRVLTVSLTLGPAGQTAQHTPEYCYPGSGYQSVGSTTTFTAPGRTADTGGFRTAVYRKNTSALAEPMRIYWAWSPAGNWSAPKYPELKFFRGGLYKLYIVSWEADRLPEEDAVLHDFLGQYLSTFDLLVGKPS